QRHEKDAAGLEERVIARDAGQRISKVAEGLVEDDAAKPLLGRIVVHIGDAEFRAFVGKGARALDGFTEIDAAVAAEAAGMQSLAQQTNAASHIEHVPAANERLNVAGEDAIVPQLVEIAEEVPAALRVLHVPFCGGRPAPGYAKQHLVQPSERHSAPTSL